MAKKRKFSFRGTDGKVKHLRLAARCERDAVVVANQGKVEFVLEIYDRESEAKTRTLTITLSGELRTELALELSAKLKKHKRVTVWAKLDPTFALRAKFLEIDDSVLYAIDQMDGSTKMCEEGDREDKEPVAAFHVGGFRRTPAPQGGQPTNCCA